MTTRVLLLRGVNVAGKRLAMATRATTRDWRTVTALAGLVAPVPAA